MRQKENKEIVPVIFVTHKTNEKALRSAIQEISELKNVVSVENVIRVER